MYKISNISNKKSYDSAHVVILYNSRCSICKELKTEIEAAALIDACIRNMLENKKLVLITPTNLQKIDPDMHAKSGNKTPVIIYNNRKSVNDLCNVLLIKLENGEGSRKRTTYHREK